MFLFSDFDYFIEYFNFKTNYRKQFGYPMLQSESTHTFSQQSYWYYW